MKKVIGLLLVLIFTVFANTAPSEVNKTNEQLKQASCKQVKGEKYARRGCCSHHGGVCGCTDGRQKCCDGSLSPSCTCHHSTPLPEQVH